MFPLHVDVWVITGIAIFCFFPLCRLKSSYRFVHVTDAKKIESLDSLWKNLIGAFLKAISVTRLCFLNSGYR